MFGRSMDIFISVAKHLNFTKAADEFHTTQPTISREIRLLEEEFGFPLFVRNTKEVRLTPGGFMLLKKAIKWKEELNETLHRAKDIEKGIEGTLRIGALETISIENGVFDFVIDLERKYPNIKISLEKCSFGILRKKFDSGFFDIIITLSFEKQYLTNTVCQDYEDLLVGFIISKRHPLYYKETISMEVFNDTTFILPSIEDSPGRGEELSDIFEQLEMKNNTIQFVDSLETVMLEVKGGRSVALVGEECEYVRDKVNFRFIPLPQLYGNLKLIVAWKKENLNPLVALYTNELCKNNLVI